MNDDRSNVGTGALLTIIGFLALYLMIGDSFGAQAPSAFFDDNDNVIVNVSELLAFANSGVTDSVNLYCHTDGRGDVKFNELLAARRCASVAALLGSQGVEVLTKVAAGKSTPLVEEIGDSLINKYGRSALNRRVEIYYAPKEVKFLRHRVQVGAGYAPSGVDPAKLIGPSTFLVKEDWDIEFSLAYSYRITRRFNIGVSGYTNKAGFLNLGLDF